jgi:hypothetical protein
MSFSRRDFLALLGTSVAGAAALSAVGKLNAGTDAAVRSTTADTWTVQAVGAVQKGAVPITLTNNASGERLVVEACRRGSGREAVASSQAFDLFLANQGDGNKQTPRHHVVAARALARHLDELGVQVPAPVLTMDARLSRHGELFDTNDDFVRG